MSNAVRNFVAELHQLWPAGNIDRLAEFYHPDVVLLPPDLGEPIVGRNAVVESYREFLSACTLHHFEVTDVSVHTFSTPGPVHMVHLRFEILYTLDEQRYAEEGLEIYTIAGSPDELRILWRSQNVVSSAPIAGDD